MLISNWSLWNVKLELHLKIFLANWQSCDLILSLSLYLVLRCIEICVHALHVLYNFIFARLDGFVFLMILEKYTPQCDEHTFAHLEWNTSISDAQMTSMTWWLGLSVKRRARSINGWESFRVMEKITEWEAVK